ncbi:hypothetical protein Mapa_000594 [Marchantia paleacea]|nr:hypothetical protein Mapa_000594 [Marchantia paleacea]
MPMLVFYTRIWQCHSLLAEHHAPVHALHRFSRQLARSSLKMIQSSDTSILLTKPRYNRQISIELRPQSMLETSECYELLKSSFLFTPNTVQRIWERKLDLGMFTIDSPNLSLFHVPNYRSYILRTSVASEAEMKSGYGVCSTNIQ